MDCFPEYDMITAEENPEGTRRYSYNSLHQQIWVCTEDGMIGWLQNKRLGEPTSKTISKMVTSAPFSKSAAIGLLMPPLIRIWVSLRTSAVETLPQTEVIFTRLGAWCTAWFYLNDNDGNIFSLASREYVNYCHQNNVDVWGPVVKSRVAGRHIIVHGKHQVVILALSGL